MLSSRPPRVIGAAVGLAGIGLVTWICLLLDLPTTIPALLLLVPITLTSMIADRRVAVSVAAAAAVAYALAFIPPIGHIRIGLTEDVFVLITFVVVSVIVSVIVGAVKSSSPQPDALGDRGPAGGQEVLLRSVSHDLRNPLATISTISTDLLDGAAAYDDGTRNVLLGRVIDESDRLNRIVGNLLSVSRVQAGALIPQIEPESIAQLVTVAARRVNRSGSHVIDVQIDDDVPDIAADSVQIDQVLTNLIENAVRYTPDGTRISITASAVGELVELMVRDDGPGFPAEVRNDPFRPSPRPGRGSTGLGLSVCKAIVDAHGGTISIRDDDRGAGVCITIPRYGRHRSDPAGRG